MSSIFASLIAAIEQDEPVALALISSIKGSSPQKQGAKAIFFADGRMEGTLGGGCLEAEVRERARLALLTQKPATFDLVLDHDFGWDDGLICGGKVSGIILPNVRSGEPVWRQLKARRESFSWGIAEDFKISTVTDQNSSEWLYQEQVTPPYSLWIAGSGHIAQAVAPLAHQLDFSVTVFDDRPALANHQYFPSEINLRVDSWETLLREETPALPTFGLILTRGHQHDARVLRNWVNRPFAFLGMIGSQRKKRLIFSRFIEEKIATEGQLSRVFCPVGVDIQAVSVREIAVSIIAQLIQKRAELCQTSP
jgi:xanthine dehydrogenase accessory factor